MTYRVEIETIGTVKETKNLESAVWAFCEHRSLENAGYDRFKGLMIALLDGKGKVIMEHPTTAEAEAMNNSRIRKILKV